MTYVSHIVKATNITTNADIVYLFTYLDDAERKLLEFSEQGSGFTGAILYKNVEEHSSYIPYEELLYDSGQSRYIENLDHI